MSGQEILTGEFLKGKVSRRDLAAGLAALGLGAEAIPGLLDSIIAPAEASTPKRGGYLRAAVGSSSAADTLDPTKTVTDADQMRSLLIYSRLIDFLPEQGLVGNLATEWEPNGDATQWSFKLKDGGEFHNGKTLTAADVAHSFNRHLNPDSGSPAHGYMSDIESIVADGETTVVFSMKQPNADLPYLLTEYHMLVHPEGMNAEEFATQTAVGTGPWMVKEFEPGIAAVLERNPNYHRSGLPYIDEIESFSIPDASARVNALRSGEVDIIDGLDPNLIHQVAGTEDVAVLSYPGAAHVTFPMMADVSPFSDNNVRLAIKHAVDRERMLNTAFNGQGLVGRDHPFPQYDPFFAEDIEALPRDPDKVAYYLKQSGMENKTFELHASDSTFGGVNTSVVMAELMREAGLDVNVKRVPADGYWSAIWMKVPWCASEWYGRPTIDLMLSAVYLSDAPWNESHWRHERFDQLVLAARRETDNARRKEMYREVQLIMRDEGSSLIPMFTNWLDGYSTRVKNLRGHPHGFAGWMYWEEVWLDDGEA